MRLRSTTATILDFINLFFNRWYRSVDKHLLLSFFVVSIISLTLISSAGPVIESRVMLPKDYFLLRHLTYLFISLCTLVAYSMMNERLIVLSSFFFMSVCIVLLGYIAFWGVGVKGAKRWFFLFGLSIQPSEFAKTLFSVVNAWILCKIGGITRYFVSTTLYIGLVSLFLLQPDLSMSIMLSLVWSSQLFVYGISYLSILVITVAFLSGLLTCLFFFPYTRERVMAFFDPANHDHFQIGNSIKSFKAGKIVGVGPGEGVVKLLLPDCHTDFIFSVAAEEFGFVMCMLILCVLGYIAARAWLFAYRESNMFKLVSVAGLFFQFSSQFMINIGVTLNLLPTTGVALPFLSYGGSSLIATSIMQGMLMAFYRMRHLGHRIRLDI
ncbi:FtsW/RodA/SpoVE family cell cycle protein [Anaplasma capra]|uniref:FtsW/RodA/SpoVE family cell cycle protein n=1 Tax=Anaplasma capra TaxID=1562740 RepID=UPI0021D5B8A7|nr:FtsW/RodA/SpoVE family cell cycle protein [Anaplasma capra]MCU7611180.1 FtsW/RodA/SpoVE family cell cycle protein [Anaplasma capra]MCU7612316.1 FtsW/RodA/SpoVE family cell cycle protein [Anaplasma capra]